jgi:lactoylglutathione lyase
MDRTLRRSIEESSMLGLEVRMSRVQLALNVDDIEEAVTFYTKLLGTGPAKRKPGYANFAVAEPPLKLVLLENPGKGGSINHLGVEVADSATVHAEIARLTGEGCSPTRRSAPPAASPPRTRSGSPGPGGERWEVYTVLADSDTFGSSPKTLIDAGQVPEGGVCCGTAQAQEASDDGTAGTATACC